MVEGKLELGYAAIVYALAIKTAIIMPIMIHMAKLRQSRCTGAICNLFFFKFGIEDFL